jgi:hypothetical protein
MPKTSNVSGLRSPERQRTRPASAGMTAGMHGHELQDAMQFQRWGFDFVKIDWCGGGGFRLLRNLMNGFVQNSEGCIVRAALQCRNCLLSRI